MVSASFSFFNYQCINTYGNQKCSNHADFFDIWIDKFSTQRPPEESESACQPATPLTRVGGANRDGRTSMSLQATAVGDALDGWREMGWSWN